MLLEDIVDYAIKGELSNLGVSKIGSRNDITSDVEDYNFKAVVNYINRGLTVLYTKFNLKQNSISVTGVTSYPHQVVMPNDYIKIIDVRNAENKPLPLRLLGSKELRVVQESHDIFSIRKHDTVSIDEASVYPIVFNYQSKLDDYTVDDMLLDIPIPHLILEPLTVYVAYKAVSAMNTNENTTAASYLARFNQLCMELDNAGVPIDNMEDVHKFTKRGFV